MMPCVYYYFHPAQPVIMSIVPGLGNNAIGRFTWAVAGIQLNVPERVLADWQEQVKEQLPEGVPPPPGINGNVT